MKRFLFATFALAIGLYCISSPAQWNGCQAGFCNPAQVSASTFQGAGDVFTASPYAWYSTARVFKASQASTATSLADLVAKTGGAAVCTLRGTATGFADLSAYCPGSVTPSAACAAASGGSCLITKLYDLSGNSRDCIQATLANMPALVFSSTPTGALPAISVQGGTTFCQTTSTFTQATPISLSAVADRNSGTTNGGVIGGTSGVNLGFGSGANLAQSSGGSPLTATAADATWHSINGLVQSGTGAVNVDGSDTTGATGNTGLSATNVRLGRANALQCTCIIAEAGFWAATSTSTDRGNLSANQHGTSGYNF